MIQVKETNKLHYRTAIYVRLSIEDNGIRSNSIENQIYFLKKYINRHTQLNLVACYCDNGKTGTNFQRSGFCEMLQAIKEEKIDCVVVKDLSRFGRNYIETGIYLEKIFPFMKVRFISIEDHYDSINATENERFELSLKNMYHDLYAKDISKKIKSILDMKRKEGLFLGNSAPFGYKKSRQNPYQLEIEEETAAVVKEIFNLRMSGMGVVKIARLLNDRGILSKNRRRYERGELKGTNGEENALWSGSSVLGILENPIYCGNLVERKSECHNKLSKKEWNLIKYTHEPIIDQKLFDQIQNLIQYKRAKKKENTEKFNTENVLKGMIICGECHGKMTRSSGYLTKNSFLFRYHYNCRRKYIKYEGCKNRSILEENLNLAVIESLKIQFSVMLNLKDITVFDKRQVFDEKPVFYHLYQRYRKGQLSKEEYILEKRNRKETYQNKIKEKEKEFRENIDRKSEIVQFLKNNRLSKELCKMFIKQIIVYQNYIKIYYTFCCELDTKKEGEK